MADNSFDLSQEAQAFLTGLKSIVSSPVHLGQLLEQFDVALDAEKLRSLATALAGFLPNPEDSISAGALWESYQGLQTELQPKLREAGVPDSLTAQLLPAVFSRFTEARHPALYALAALLGVVALESKGDATPVWGVARAWAALTDTHQFAGKDLIPGAADLLSALGLRVTINFAEGDAPVFSIFLGEAAGFRMAWSGTLGLMIAPFEINPVGEFETDGWKLEWAFPERVTALSIHPSNGLLTEPPTADWTGASLNATHVDSGISLKAEITPEKTMILTLGIGAYDMNLMQDLTAGWSAIRFSYDVAGGVSRLAIDDLVLKAESLNKFWGKNTETKLSLNVSFKEGTVVADSSFIDLKAPALGRWPLSGFDLQTDGDRKLELSFPPAVLGSLGLAPTSASDAPATLHLGIDQDDHLYAGLSIKLTSLAVNLGSPLARLELNSPVTFAMSTETGVSLSLPGSIEGAFSFDLFAQFAGTDAVVNSIWGPEAQGLLLSVPFSIPAEQAPAPAVQAIALANAGLQPAGQAGDSPSIRWQDGKPQLRAEWLKQTLEKTGKFTTNGKTLASLSGEVPVVGTAMKAALEPGSGGPRWHAGDGNQDPSGIIVPLEINLEIGTKTLSASGDVRLVAPLKDGYITLEPGAFAMGGNLSSLTVNDGFEVTLDDLLVLTVPAYSRFDLSLDPSRPQLQWNPKTSQENTDARITLSVPATDDGFTFEMENFRIHSAGIDLRGAVRTGSVNLADAGFAAPVGVKGVQRNGVSASDDKKPRPHQIGEIEFKNSRLVYGSLQASAKLPYFDDAVGTLTLFLSQGENQSLACAGTLDISGIDEFHIDDLFITVQVDHLQLGVKYDQKWSSKASLTGRVKFQPPKGRSASDMGELSSLFEGVTLEFENLNPLQGKGTWALSTPPKRFTLADILTVDLRGVNIELGESESGKKVVTGCDLLGDISIQKLPGIDASLTFGGISLEPNGSKPECTVKKIGAQFSAPGGFRMSGELHHVSTPIETGFAGGFTLKIDALPELGGMLKLTRVTLSDGAIAPSLALFVERATEVELLYGFYLRRLGIGVGVRQALRGLEPDSPIPANQRLIKFVDNPAGLPDPIFVDNWQPVRRPKPLSWMLVGAGLITFGNLPEDKPHLIAGSFLLSLDQDLRLLLGANLWLFTSPRETRDAQFMQRPVARGAIELSARGGYLRAYLRTIKGPRLGKEAPPLLAEVLSKVETSLFYQVDRNGFIAEIGWPWETRIEYNLGDYFKGMLQTGYRYGFYRGVLVYGLNFAMSVRLEASQSLSFGVRGASAEARLEVTGEADFRASFVGALDTANWRGYLMGDVRLDALVSVRASASARIKISRWIKISISFSATLTVSITAALTAAMDSRPAIGFEGTAEVAISVCGYGISGSVAFSHNTGVISDVRSKLQELLQPISGGPAGMALLAAAGEGQEEDLKPLWHYRFHWLDPVEEGAAPRLRVLLIPADEYPGPTDDPKRFGLTLKKQPEFTGLAGSAFTGFAGYGEVIEPDASAHISWSEALQESVRLQGLVDEEIARAYLKGRKAEIENGGPEEEVGELDGIKAALQDIKHEMAENVPQEVTDAQKLGSLLKQSGWVTPIGGDDTNTVMVADHRFDPDYDTRLARASNTQNGQEAPPPLPAGLLIAELLSLLKDTSVVAGEDANATRPATDWYRAAHMMKLVLEFEVPTDWRQRRDPVPDLIDLDSLTVVGKPVDLQPVLGRDAPPVEYDLIPGPVHQERGRVCLTWDFLREDEVQGTRQGAGRDDFAPYAELDEYVVTRHNLSRPNERPRVVATRPAWIVQREPERRVLYLRPPFQFIDDHLENVQEGDFLQYRVEAHATDRVLASTLIIVRRSSVEPLPPVGQTLALHTPPGEGVQESIVFVVPAWEPDKSRKEQDADPNELVIAYRSVPAARFGAYGYDLRPASPTRWVDGLPARRDVPDFPQIKFAESSEGRPLPWEETTVLSGKNGLPEPEWTLKTLTYYDPRVGRDVLKHVFRCEITQWPRPESGQTIEFYIGRRKPSATDRPEEKSDLVRCHHAVAASEPQSWLRGEGTLDLNVGNTVDAFEQLVEQRKGPEFIEPAYMQIAVAYPDTPDTPPTTEEPEKLDSPEIVLTWRHRKRSDFQEAGHGDPFDPVIGYRIHCLDRYDPAEYPLPDGTLPARPLVMVRAIPDRLYRATPETIVVEGVPSVQSDAQARAKLLQDHSLRTPQDMAQELQVRLIEAQEALDFSPNWISVPQAEKTMTAEQAGAEGLTPVPFRGTEGLLWDAGPIYLQQGLIDVLKKLADNFNATCRLILHHPLEQRAIVGRADAADAADAVAAETLTALVAGLVSQLDGRNDPYGWWLAEALGMSCECVLLDSNDVPIAAESIRDHLANSGAAAPCSVAFFRADDGRTLLNVFRVTSQRDDGIKPALVCRTTSVPIPRDPEQKKTNAELLQEWRKIVGELWPENMEVAWEAKPPEPDPGKVYLPKRLKDLAGEKDLRREYVHQGRVEGTTDARPATVELPIAADGTLTYRWRAPDLWGHRYTVAIETIRRHDALWRRLTADRKPLQDQEAPQDGVIEPDVHIETKHFREVLVSRTQELVEHNLVVTPLPGSIQALVFRHPAAFAAAASAVNAVHGQYAGQTVILERRIGGLESLIALYKECNAWQGYQPFGENGVQPEVVPNIWTDKEITELTPIGGTEAGIYGADRYVYPDLPGYYQYRVAVYSAAGRRQSPLTVSDWQDPIYDEDRQRPVAIAPSQARFQRPGTLDIFLPVVHNALPLRPKLRSLWRQWDEELQLGEVKIPLGDLPDLHLLYQLYLRTNPVTPQEGRDTAVYVPLCRIVGPKTQVEVSSGIRRSLGFTLETQVPNVGASDWGVDCAQRPLRQFRVVIQGLDSPTNQPLLGGLNTIQGDQGGDALPFIAVAVQRNGVWSAPVTGGDTNPFINAEAPHA